MMRSVQSLEFACRYGKLIYGINALKRMNLCVEGAGLAPTNVLKPYYVLCPLCRRSFQLQCIIISVSCSRFPLSRNRPELFRMDVESMLIVGKSATSVTLNGH